MSYPLVDKELISLLRTLHGLFNSGVLLLFLFQAGQGIAIRRARKSKAPSPVTVIRRHRNYGPVFAGLAVVGYVFGLVLVLVNTGRLLEYPAHLITGTLLLLLIALSLTLSRRIRGQDSPYRTPHFVTGIILLAVFIIQALLGIGALF